MELIQNYHKHCQKKTKKTEINETKEHPYKKRKGR